ncbi:MAG: hypothetical protein ACRD9R_11380 [Pyrinomonadaceae bacterium]
MPTRIIGTNAPRVALEAIRPDLAVQIPLTVKNGFKVEQGDVLGIITASGLARRRTRAVAAGAGFATNSPSGQVDDVSVFVAGDVLENSAGAAVGTVQSVNSQTNVVTLTGNAAVAVAAGGAVFGSDGSEQAEAISDNETDGAGDTVVSAFICGLLDETKLRGLDETAKAELGGVSVAGDIFKF